LAALFAFYLFTIYNGLIEVRNNIDRAWANIDVLLKQRSDLIPNLVETVKGYMKHEKQMLIEITKLRAALVSSDSPGRKAAASDAISAGLKSIFAVSENYPKLMASENFLELQKQLAAIENQLADRREFYNNSVLLYNTRIKVMPDTIIASTMGFREREYFKAEEGEKAAVQVKME